MFRKSLAVLVIFALVLPETLNARLQVAGFPSCPPSGVYSQTEALTPPLGISFVLGAAVLIKRNAERYLFISRQKAVGLSLAVALLMMASPARPATIEFLPNSSVYPNARMRQLVPPMGFPFDNSDRVRVERALQIIRLYSERAQARLPRVAQYLLPLNTTSRLVLFKADPTAVVRILYGANGVGDMWGGTFGLQYSPEGDVRAVVMTLNPQLFKTDMTVLKTVAHELIGHVNNEAGVVATPANRATRERIAYQASLEFLEWASSQPDQSGISSTEANELKTIWIPEQKTRIRQNGGSDSSSSSSLWKYLGGIFFAAWGIERFYRRSRRIKSPNAKRQERRKPQKATKRSA